MRLLEYRKYKDFQMCSGSVKKEWSKVCWKLPEVITLAQKDEIVEMIPDELKGVYTELLERNRKKMNPNVNGINRIIQHEKVSMRSKMRGDHQGAY